MGVGVEAGCSGLWQTGWPVGTSTNGNKYEGMGGW